MIYSKAKPKDYKRPLSRKKSREMYQIGDIIFADSNYLIEKGLFIIIDASVGNTHFWSKSLQLPFFSTYISRKQIIYKIKPNNLLLKLVCI